MTKTLFLKEVGTLGSIGVGVVISFGEGVATGILTVTVVVALLLVEYSNYCKSIVFYSIKRLFCYLLIHLLSKNENRNCFSYLVLFCVVAFISIILYYTFDVSGLVAIRYSLLIVIYGILLIINYYNYYVIWYMLKLYLEIYGWIFITFYLLMVLLLFPVLCDCFLFFIIQDQDTLKGLSVLNMYSSSGGGKPSGFIGGGGTGGTGPPNPDLTGVTAGVIGPLNSDVNSNIRYHENVHDLDFQRSVEGQHNNTCFDTYYREILKSQYFFTRVDKYHYRGIEIENYNNKDLTENDITFFGADNNKYFKFRNPGEAIAHKGSKSLAIQLSNREIYNLLGSLEIEILQGCGYSFDIFDPFSFKDLGLVEHGNYRNLNFWGLYYNNFFVKYDHNLLKLEDVI